MPGSFSYPHDAAVWLPLDVGGDPHNTYIRPVIGRLRPSASQQQARAELEALARHWPLVPGTSREKMVADVLPMKDLLVGNIRKSLLIFMGAVAFVLLIACANVANLLLMRGASRQREVAIRNALGASRWRVIRQLLSREHIVVTGRRRWGNTCCDIGSARFAGTRAGGRSPAAGGNSYCGLVLAFSLGLGIFVGILFGLAPALRATGLRVRDSLSLGGRASTGGRQRLRSFLVISEIAMALVLLTGAGLMIRTFILIRAVDPGYRTENILTMTVDLPDASYPTATAIQSFSANVLAKISSKHGVIAAGAVNWMPLQPALVRGDFKLDGGRKLPPGFIVAKPAVSPDYFRVMESDSSREGIYRTGQQHRSGRGHR